MFVQAPRHKSVCEGEGTVSHIFNLGSRRKVGVRFTLGVKASLHFEEKICRTP